MKTTILSAFLCLSLNLAAFAQQAVRRDLGVKYIERDSVHIPLSADYLLIENDCAQILRQVRYNTYQKTFYGHFTDVNFKDPEQVLGQGTYTADGMKTGLYTIYYPNGKLRAQGHFSNNQFTGDWSTWYQNGNPKAKFTVTDGLVTVQQAWSEDGKQTVTDGNGSYQVGAGLAAWSGDIMNGRPEGTWRAKNPLERDKVSYLVEKFKDGQFQKGTGPIGSYTDESRIMWFNATEYPFLNAEEMLVAYPPCGYNKITDARFSQGFDAYSKEISQLVGRSLKGDNLKLYNSELRIEGEIAENGRLINLSYTNPFNDRIASAITRELRKLPALEPATANGKAIKQDFEIVFRFNSGGYTFSYRFLPIDPKSM